MVELSKERIDKILHEETPKEEKAQTVLLSVYTRYRRLYEDYFTDIDALTDDRVAELRKYYEDTESLIKTYYLFIPQDVCVYLERFDGEYTEKLLGPDWRRNLFDRFEEFAFKSENEDSSRNLLKAKFQKHTLSDFYDAMSYVFRDSFGTGSESFKSVAGGIIGMLFGKEKQKNED